jgi:hypothetical protein
MITETRFNETLLDKDDDDDDDYRQDNDTDDDDDDDDDIPLTFLETIHFNRYIVSWEHETLVGLQFVSSMDWEDDLSTDVDDIFSYSCHNDKDCVNDHSKNNPEDTEQNLVVTTGLSTNNYTSLSSSSTPMCNNIRSRSSTSSSASSLPPSSLRLLPSSPSLLKRSVSWVPQEKQKQNTNCSKLYRQLYAYDSDSELQNVQKSMEKNSWSYGESLESFSSEDFIWNLCLTSTQQQQQQYNHLE